MDFDCDAAGTVLIRWHAKMNLFVWLQFILLAKEWKEEFVKANKMKKMYFDGWWLIYENYWLISSCSELFYNFWQF